MRIRTLAALATGAALGASSVYLLDPDAGPTRRRDALRRAIDRSKDVDWVAVAGRTGSAATAIGRRAATGYRDGVSST